MELTAEIVTALKAVHLFCKNFHLDVWQGSERTYFKDLIC